MSTYSEAFEETAHNAFCSIANQGVAAGLLFTALSATTIAGAIGGIAVAAGSAHLYATYCGRVPPPPPYGAPQDWEGGQCDNVLYDVNLRFALYIYSGGQPVFAGMQNRIFTVMGKISFIDIIKDEQNFNQTTGIIVAKEGSINQVLHPGETNDNETPVWNTDSFEIIITRQDGLPDDCGNPEPDPPANEFDSPGNIIYINPEGDTINTPVTFNFNAPIIGILGNVFIPVNIRFNLDPTLNISGRININGGDFILNVGDPRAPIGDGDSPGDVFIPPGTPPGTPPGVPPEPEPEPSPTEDTPPYLIIRGVIVTTLQDETSATIIFQENAPDIYAPSLGYVSFLCVINEQYAWTADIPVKNRKQIIECPWRYGAIEVRATPKSGAQFETQIVYDVNSIAQF